MGCIAERSCDSAHFFIIVTRVQTQSLISLLHHLPKPLALNTFRHTRQSGRRHFHIVTVSALNLQPHRNAPGFSQQAPFNTAFAAIGGIGAAFFPHPAVLLSLRPALKGARVPATPNPTPSVRRNRTKRFPTAGRRNRLLSILETGRAPWNPSRSPSHQGLSTGSRFEARKKCRLKFGGQEREDGDSPEDGLSFRAPGSKA